MLQRLLIEAPLQLKGDQDAAAQGTSGTTPKPGNMRYFVDLDEFGDVVISDIEIWNNDLSRMDPFLPTDNTTVVYLMINSYLLDGFDGVGDITDSLLAHQKTHCQHGYELFEPS